jgi:hypothetical protein
MTVFLPDMINRQVLLRLSRAQANRNGRTPFCRSFRNEKSEGRWQGRKDQTQPTCGNDRNKRLNNSAQSNVHTA